MMQWMRAFALLLVVLAASPAPARALYKEGGVVELLDESNFEEKVLSSDDFWVVEFYAPWCGHCKKLAPEFKSAAKELIGTAKLGAVDCDVEENKPLCSKYGVKGFPTLKSFGTDKEKPQDYSGARESAAIVSYAQEQTGEGSGGGASGGSKLAPILSYLQTYTFLHTLDSELPKFLLLTEGEKSTPSWLLSLAATYKEGRSKSMAFAHVRTDAADAAMTAKRFGVTSFPAFVAAQPSGDGHSGWFATLSGMAGEEKSKVAKQAKAFAQRLASAGFPEDERAPLPAFPPPDLPRKKGASTYAALDADNIDRVCYKNTKKPICVVAFVDAAGTDEFKENDLLAEVATKYRSDPFSFVWIDGGIGASLRKGFNIKSVPSLVAIKTGKRNRFAAFAGAPAFDAPAIGKFLDGVLGGDATFTAIKTLPELEPDYLNFGDEEETAAAEEEEKKEESSAAVAATDDAPAEEAAPEESSSVEVVDDQDQE